MKERGVLVNYREDDDFITHMDLHVNKYGYGSRTQFIKKATRLLMDIDNNPSVLYIKTK